MNKKILIVEDEKMLGEVYQDKLEEGGVMSDLVLSAEEALDYLKTKKPDLILLDIILPRQNGISFLKNLKKLPELSDVPVVAFSNYDDPTTKKEAKELGVKDYLLKTQYTPQELLLEIKKILHKSAPNRTS